MSIDAIKTQTQKLLDHLQVQAEVVVAQDNDSGYYNIQLDTEQPGLLIGYRGETLASLQLILGLIINQQSKDDKDRKKILINVNDYRQRREETLTQLAHNAAQKVKFSGEPYYFDNLSPAERRAVHLALQEDEEITTYSEGDGPRRTLVVTRK